jgi:hypothetical protein
MKANWWIESGLAAEAARDVVFFLILMVFVMFLAIGKQK